MASRPYDFTSAQKESIRLAYNNVCAACGCDDVESLHVDHWQAGESDADGVCLCAFCNVKVKGKRYIPDAFMLTPKKPLTVVTHAEYKAQVAANRQAFLEWANRFKFRKGFGGDYWKKIGKFKPPF